MFYLLKCQNLGARLKKLNNEEVLKLIFSNSDDENDSDNYESSDDSIDDDCSDMEKSANQSVNLSPGCSTGMDKHGDLIWEDSYPLFAPKYDLPAILVPKILSYIDRNSSELDCLLKMFPHSLVIFIAQNTNERMKQKANYSATDAEKLCIFIGCCIIMSYNHVPEIKHYWSNDESLGNAKI